MFKRGIPRRNLVLDGCSIYLRLLDCKCRCLAAGEGQLFDTAVGMPLQVMVHSGIDLLVLIEQIRHCFELIVVQGVLCKDPAPEFVYRNEVPITLFIKLRKKPFPSRGI
ncbi:hypothetical protein [Pseudomonas serbica]|uniref:hypothetical protein n=1 Tax=Pseudomonas serbica TaxID=2965074 RepID=UPI00237B5A77|nr:hypothetical protein [Pseudomonas serbica]